MLLDGMLNVTILDKMRDKNMFAFVIVETTRQLRSNER